MTPFKPGPAIQPQVHSPFPVDWPGSRASEGPQRAGLALLIWSLILTLIVHKGSQTHGASQALAANQRFQLEHKLGAGSVRTLSLSAAPWAGSSSSGCDFAACARTPLVSPAKEPIETYRLGRPMGYPSRRGNLPQLRRTGHVDRAGRARWASLASCQRRPSFHRGLHTVRSVVIASYYQSGREGAALAVRFDRPFNGQHASPLWLPRSLSPQAGTKHSLKSLRRFTSAAARSLRSAPASAHA
jgi:hypothetical protein